MNRLGLYLEKIALPTQDDVQRYEAETWCGKKLVVFWSPQCNRYINADLGAAWRAGLISTRQQGAVQRWAWECQEAYEQKIKLGGNDGSSKSL